MKHDDLAPITRDEYTALFHGPSQEGAGEGLLRLAWHEAEATWAERECVAALRDVRLRVRLAAATALGHLARRQKGLGPSTIGHLCALTSDPDIGGHVEDALDDLAVFSRSSTRS